MDDYRRLPSPNRTDRVISVEFLILHFTAVDLQGTLDIFLNPDSQVSAHLVVDLDGSVFEMVDCLEGKALRGWHAGDSCWQQWSEFNDFSVGIELVNNNGNLFEFTDAQYESLQWIVTRLKQHYPELSDPERVLGHEHIAGHRGKADPGLCFDWKRFYKACYPDHEPPVREALLPEKLQQSLLQLAENEPKEMSQKQKFWCSVSRVSESALTLIWQEKKDV